MSALTIAAEKIKVSIIEDSDIHSEWLKQVLQADRHFDVVSVDRLAKIGVESIKKNHADVVLLDFQLEDMTGLEAIKRIVAHNESIKIFMITAHTEITIIERIINDKNIKGLAIKGSQYFGLNLKSAVQAVATGGVYVDPTLLEKLRGSSKENGISNLSRREFEVFIQSNSGKSDSKIAEDLCVEIAYIKNIKSKITKKVKDTNLGNLLDKLVENTNPCHLAPGILL
ncbi:MAG: hypothetical protein A3F13_08825 [Gammaproteobacteria bacterium RIFCSPHIGHO2_12_FULL_40_19]|nr:MAG: hypothetical protein A3F13_08825 [Gammaproteobacteria bacterium RIFCSPHIGHO2_12_FULL_40_19]